MPPTPSSEAAHPGFELGRTLRGHSRAVRSIAWAPDGGRLYTASLDQTVIAWDARTGQVLRTMRGHRGPANGVAATPDGKFLVSAGVKSLRVWNAATGAEVCVLRGHTGPIQSLAILPDGRRVASASNDGTLRIWDLETRTEVRCFLGHRGPVSAVAAMPDGGRLVSGSADRTLKVWDVHTRAEVRRLSGHADVVNAVAVLPDGRRVVSASKDRTLKVWDTATGREERTLEGHTEAVISASVSSDGRYLATASWDDTVRVWDCATWRMVAALPAAHTSAPIGLGFHPSAATLATLGDDGSEVRLWSLDPEAISRSESEATEAVAAVRYANAKVVLVGDTGVGKSGLSLVLTGRPYETTESSHGRRVWVFDSQRVDLGEGQTETRETLLWDLAGQPGYRLIHQLHLNEVVVALVVCDSRSEVDPFCGVGHWNRALRQAAEVNGGSTPMKKFLVAARADRGGLGVTRDRIDGLLSSNRFDGYFETSAKEGWRVDDLAEAIRRAIDWDALPRVHSNELFHTIKEFLLDEKKGGHVLSSADELYRSLLRLGGQLEHSGSLRDQFDTCICLIENRGLIRRLDFGDLILLQPELLDSYASALVNAAKEEPDGLGSISESEAQSGNFRIPEEERVLTRAQERLLLIATIEDLLRHEIALRESAEGGPYLIFPSHLTREWMDAPEPPGRAAVFAFEGPVLNLYATLVVRLSHSGQFARDQMWRNAALFTADVGGRCGLSLREFEEGKGELTVFYDGAPSAETRFRFEEFVHAHLRARALSGSVRVRRIAICPSCGEPVPDRTLALRRERNFDWVQCAGCDTRVSLAFEQPARPDLPRTVSEMTRKADVERDRAAALSVLDGKLATGHFDVFLCYNHADKPAVKRVAEELRSRGLLTWMDEREMRPGLAWHEFLGQQIDHIKAAAVFVGASGLGTMQRQEVNVLISEFVPRNRPIIPVVLADAPSAPDIPVFLRPNTWVDFRKSVPDPLEELFWGITGRRGAGT